VEHETFDGQNPNDLSQDDEDLTGALGEKPDAPFKKKKTFEEDKQGEEKKTKKTVEMFDLMIKQGSKLKAYSKQDEDRIKAQQKLKKLGLDSISDLDKELQA